MLEQNNKVVAILAIGVIAGLLFFSAGLKFNKAGSELLELRSKSGTSVAEAYYQEMGQMNKGFSTLSYALGLSVFGICLGVAFNESKEDEIKKVRIVYDDTKGKS